MIYLIILGVITIFFIIKKLYSNHVELKENARSNDKRYDDLYSRFYSLSLSNQALKKQCLEKDSEIRAAQFNAEKKIQQAKIENEAIVNKMQEQIDEKEHFIEQMKSNVTAFPWMAEIMADYETYGIEALAQSLNWGHDQQRLHKVKSIQEIRNDAKAIVEKNKESQYQLAYLLEMFPNLKDVIDTDYSQLPIIQVDDISDYDKSRDYLSKDEYQQLNSIERNQLALDRYVSSHNKTKWQIGRDYELYVGHTFEKEGYSVEYYGEQMGLEDLGRDLIVTKGLKTYIVQCKYWSSVKLIHEKHITQLYGTLASYCIEHDTGLSEVKGLLITNIQLSDMAKKMAGYLGIEYRENVALQDYPRIKCNIGRDEFGRETKIYHLPFDQQYDAAKIDKPGEFFAYTVQEAEEAGFRRAFKWFGSN